MKKQLHQGCYVVLHVAMGPSKAQEKNSPSLVVTGGERFALTDEIWIERLDEQLAKNIQKACEPPHFNIDSSGHDKHLYAFVRRVPASEKSRYEGMGELQAVTALSRLIHPTSVGDRYCANVFHFGLADSGIQSIQYRGISPDVFIDGKERDWLSVEDCELLRKLMPWLSNDKPMHGRVRRAYWNHEYAMRSYYLDMRWILVVSGLEALISTGERDLAWEFRDRVGQLAGEFGINLTDGDLTEAWKLRSKLVHAENFLYQLETRLPKDGQNDLYQRLESLFRMTINRSLLDEGFGHFFRDGASVKARWPIKTKLKK